MATAKKAKRGIWLEVLLVILVLLIVIAIGVLVSTKDQVINQDKCVEDYCEGTMWYECSVQADGFKAHVLRGEVPGKCALAIPQHDSIQEAPQQIKKVVKQAPPITVKAVKVEKCGNGELELGEGCGTCPEDAPCTKGFSCIENECRQLGLARVKGAQYCGYLPGLVSRRDERVQMDMIDYYASCEEIRSGSTGDKVYDSKVGIGEQVWLCSDKTGLTLPQYVSMKLDKERVINRIRILESHLRDDLNVKVVRLQVSVDSTDGIDGHWLELGSTTFTNDNNKSFAEIYTDPTSARWVRILVDDVWSYPIKQFAIGEIVVYEAKYICNDDYDARVYKQ